eukprot:jgi/Bigna1/77243/fgenesh1_pg.46_\
MTTLRSSSFRESSSLLFGMVSLVLVVNVEASVQATANPYMEDTCPADSCRCPALSLNPLAAMTDAALPTQPDTFMKLVRKKHMGFELPIYHFKQPERISHLQLPFKVLPMYSIDETDLKTLRRKRRPECFLGINGQYWCAEFARFFALIVQYGEENKQKSSGNAEIETEEALTIGIPAPSWMAAAAMVMSESKSTAL